MIVVLGIQGDAADAKEVYTVGLIAVQRRRPSAALSADHNGEYDKITKAGGTYCDTFGAEDATSGYDEFLGYFMPRKVRCGKETMQDRKSVV